MYQPQFNPPGPYDPNPGGNSSRPAAPFGELRRAACVSGTWQGIRMTAGCFAQELGHNFGLEPAGSPHFQDPTDPGHSKDAIILDPFAFDFVLQRHYTAPIGDTMNNMGGGAFKGADAILFNAYDWEFMRKQFVSKPGGTGPGSPAQCR